MSKKIKKFLKNNNFLKDKYTYYSENKDNIINEKGNFVSDEQIKKLLPIIKDDSRFKVELKFLENKTHIKFIDLIYFLFVFLLLPTLFSIYVFNNVFKVSDVGWIVSLGGSFGSFMLLAVVLNMALSDYYVKLIGGESFKDVNKKRAFERFCNKIRSSKNIMKSLQIILSQFRTMDKFYKNRTIGENDQRELYTEVNPSEYSNNEKELINIIIEEINEEEYLKIMNNNKV